MTNEKKPREFWVRKSDRITFDELLGPADIDLFFHVIEKSAYDSMVADYGTCSADRDTLLAENERLKKEVHESKSNVGRLRVNNQKLASEKGSLHLEAVKLAEALEQYNAGDLTPVARDALPSFHTFLKKEKGE